MATQLIHTDSREAWLEARRDFITGTDVAAILGLSPWRSPLDVFMEKKGLAEAKEETEAMRWGKRMEPFILAAFAEQTKLATRPWPEFDLIRDTEAPLGVTLDATCLEPGDDDDLVVPVELKNIRYARPEEWGEQGTDQVPNYYLTQVMLQIHLTERKHGYIVPLVAGQELRIYRVGYDPDLAAVMQERAEAWWKRHILGDEPPPVDGSDSCSRYLAQRFARHTEATKEATPEVLEWIRRRKEAEATMKAAEAEKKEAENMLKAYLGDAQGIPGLVTWKNNKDSEVVDWEALARETLSADALATALPKFTTIKPGARVLRFSAAK